MTQEVHSLSRYANCVCLCSIVIRASARKDFVTQAETPVRIKNYLYGHKFTYACLLYLYVPVLRMYVETLIANKSPPTLHLFRIFLIVI